MIGRFADGNVHSQRGFLGTYVRGFQHVCAYGFALLSALLLGCGSGGAVSPSGPAIGVICIPSGCLSGAHYDGTVSLGSIDPSTLTLSVCRNGACAHTQLRAGSVSGRYVGQIAPPLSVDAWLETSVSPARLWVYIFGRPELLLDGDVYELSVSSPSMTLVRIPPTAVTYVRTDIRDPNCAAACVSVRL